MYLQPSAPTMRRMAPKKKPLSAGGDRHKPSKMFRVPTRMAELLEELAVEELGSSAAEQLKIAIREYLHRKGKLTPKPTD